MGIIRRFRNRKKPIFDVKRWVDYERLQAGAKGIRESLSIFVVQRKATHVQTLEQVMQRLHLTEKDIEERKKVFFQLLLLMLFITGCLFLYMIYLLIGHHFLGAMVCMALIFMTLGLCFKYHFWCFQLKQRKLGCTFKEWLTIGLLGSKK